jgi:hypothetical protein
MQTSDLDKALELVARANHMLWQLVLAVERGDALTVPPGSVSVAADLLRQAASNLDALVAHG